MMSKSIKSANTKPVQLLQSNNGTNNGIIKTNTNKANPPSTYKLDSTKTILNGLILTPNFFGSEHQPLYDNEQSTYEQDFHPPVPHSTATLLSMAEEKIKAMSSNPRNNTARGNSGNRKAHHLGKLGASAATTPTALHTPNKPIWSMADTAGSDKMKSLPPNDNNTTSTDPLKWLRGGEAASKKRPMGQTRRNFKSSPASSNKLKDIFAPEEPDKLITIGGYIINIEKGLPPQMSTSVRPSVSSNERGVEIEVRIKEVDPTKIVVEKRYNSILVIGVKESGLKPPREKLDRSDTSLPFGFEDDVLEVVNIFAPRDVSLTRVMVTPADSKGRIFIKAP